MINKTFKTIILLLLSITLSLASNLENNLATIGFSINDPHKKVNDIYEDKYGNPNSEFYDKEYKKTLDTLSFFPVANDVKLNSLLKKKPGLAAFAPFNLLMYKKLDDAKSYIGHLEPNVMLDIVGVSDTVIRKEFISMIAPLDTLMYDKLNIKKIKQTYAKLPAKPMMNLELVFASSADVSEFVDKFQDTFEEMLEEHNYLITGYKDYKEVYSDLDMDFDEYDTFLVYSICDFEFSYNLFNKGRPDVGVFAPCNIYMYIKKGTNKLVIGMPRLVNWVSVMGLKDKKIIQDSKDIDAEILSIMEELGAIDR